MTTSTVPLNAGYTPPTPASPEARPAPSYRHAHWYFLAALAAIVAGFWPSFF